MVTMRIKPSSSRPQSYSYWRKTGERNQLGPFPMRVWGRVMPWAGNITGENSLCIQLHLRYGDFSSCLSWKYNLLNSNNDIMVLLVMTHTQKIFWTQISRGSLSKRNVFVLTRVGVTTDEELDRIYWQFIHTTCEDRQQSAIATLHTFQFTAAHALGFSVFTSLILPTDLNSHFKPFMRSSFLAISSQSPPTAISRTRPNSLPTNVLYCAVLLKVNLRLALYRQSVRLGVKPLETHDQRFFFQLNSCGNSPHPTSSLTRRCVCLLWICLAFRTQLTPDLSSL
jgi:hypothetical protein